MKKRYKLTAAYDGYPYHGFQKQKNRISVQETLEKALSKTLGSPIKITGSGRTDRGVHALGQVAHFDSFHPIDIDLARKYLPPSLQLLSIEEVATDFHARYSAIGKIYTYCVQVGSVASPFAFRFSHHSRSAHLPEIKAKAKVCVGSHDFASFTNKGSSPKDTVRQIYNIEITRTPFGFYVLFLGNGFLYKMVRNLMGAFLAENLSTKEMQDLLEGKDREKAPPPAPAKGLFLTGVVYDAEDLGKYVRER